MAAKHALSLLGVVTYASNHHPTQTIDQETGKITNHFLRDSVDAPKRQRTTAKKAQPATAAAAKPDNVVFSADAVRRARAAGLNVAEARWRRRRKRIWASNAEMSDASTPAPRRMDVRELEATTQQLLGTAAANSKDADPMVGAHCEDAAIPKASLDCSLLDCERHPPRQRPQRASASAPPLSRVSLGESIMRLLS